MAADKTRNLYELSSLKYNKLLKGKITKTYKKSPITTEDNINKEAKTTAQNLDQDDRMNCIAKAQAFIALKEHQNNS